MKILVISDSHGNIKNLEHVVGFGKRIGVKAIIHCGDWNTVSSIEVVLQSRIPLYTVLGNADIDPVLIQNLKSKSKKYNSKYLTFETGGKKIGVIHKFINHKSKIMNLDVLFCGHYHSQKEWEVSGVKVIRPGALENNINFVIYDTETDKIEFLNDKV